MKRRTTLSILIAMIILVVTSFVVYAAFTVEEPFAGDVGYHEITLTDTNLTATVPSDLSFTTPGEQVSFKYSLNNSSTKAYNYYFTLTSSTGTTPTNTELLNMIFVYQDGEYCGVLGDYVEGGLTNTLPKKKVVFKGETLDNATTLTYELHNSAYGYDDNKIKLNLECHVETTNAQKYIYVSTAEEFSKAIDDVNRGADKVIVLTDKITTSTTYTLSSNCSIDLAGNILTLGAAINVDAELTIYDSRNNGSVAGAGKFVLNTANSFVQLDVPVASSNLDISTYNATRLYECLINHLNTIKYFVNGDTYDIYGNYKVYGTNFYTFSEDISFTNDVATVTSNGVAAITCNSQKLEFKTYLSDTANQLDDILKNELKHIVAFNSTETSTYDVLHDIYLPTAVKRYNATISWWSSDHSVLSNDGRTQDKQGFVNLIATIKLNNEIFTETFLIHIAKQDDMMKLQYLVSKIGYIVLDQVGTVGAKVLPIRTENLPDKYLNLTEEEFNALTDDEKKECKTYYKYYTSGEDLGITEISYEVEDSYYYLSLQNENEVYLNQMTFQKYARVKIKALFDGGSDEGEESYVNIRILLTNDTALQEKVFDYVQSKFDEVNVLELILASRDENGVNMECGDFVMPNEYMNISIRYDINTTLSYGSIVTNTSIITKDGYAISLDLNKLNVNETRVPINVTLVSDGADVKTKTLYFNVPAALTMDNFNIPVDLFNTLQLQTLQYSSEIDTRSNYFITEVNGNATDIIYFYEIKSIDKITGLKNYHSYEENYSTERKKYILMYDIEKCNELIFELGDTSTVLDKYELTHLEALFDWATGNKNDNSLRDNVPVDSTLDWITADGLPEISDAEIIVILNYCERFVGFENEWVKDIYVGDNILSQEEIVDLMATLVNNDFITLLDWAQGNTVSVVPTVSSRVFPDYMATNKSDGMTSISYLEEEIIVDFINNTSAFDLIVKNNLLKVWNESIKKNDDVYLLSDDETIPLMTSDYILSSLLVWQQTTDEHSLSDYLNSGEINALFEGNNPKNESWAPGITGNRYYNSSDNEWEVIKYYFLTAYNVDLTKYIYYYDNQDEMVYQDYNGARTDLYIKLPNFDECRVATSQYYFLIGTRYYFTDDFIELLQNFANSLFNNMDKVQKILTWATGTTISKSDVNLLSSFSIDAQNNIDLNTRYSDGFKTISIFEYSGLSEYYDSNACNNTITGSYNDASGVGVIHKAQPVLKDWLKNYYIDSKVDLTFSDQNLSDKEKESLYEMTKSTNLETFKALIEKATVTTNPDNTENPWYDNLYTISEQEYEKFIASFNIDLFKSKLNTYIKFEETPDRKLDNKESLINYVKEFLGYNLETFEDNKFKYSLINLIDSNDIKVMEFLKFYINLIRLSINGNSQANITSESKIADELFSIISNNCKLIEELDFTYALLSDISSIGNLIYLKMVNFRGNKTLKNIHHLLEVNNGQIQRINIYGTAVDFNYVEPDFVKMYIDYKTINNKNPFYYYDLKGVETLFEITGDIDQEDYPAMDLCYLLAPINKVSSNRLQLPKSVYILVDNVVTEVPIQWKKVDGSVSNPIESSDEKGYYVITNGGEMIISATISYGNGSYTRYFTFINE